MLWNHFNFIVQGVKLKMSKLSSVFTSTEELEHLFFIIIPDDTEINDMLSIITKLKTKVNIKPKHFTACFWSSPIPPKFLPILTKEKITIQEFNLGLIPIENDLLSLELHNGFNELSLSSNLEICEQVKNSIVLLESLYGSIPTKYAKGKWASLVYDSLPKVESNAASRIDALVLLDRELDMITPLLLQMTYEGLIDEFMGINFGEIKFHDQFINLLDDPLFYQTCRNVHFNAVKTEFKKIVEKIESLKKRVYDARSAGETAQFMKQVRDIKKAKLETTLPLRILNTYIDSSISSDIDKLLTLPNTRQLIVLQTDILSGCDIPKYVIPPLEYFIAQGDERLKERVLRLMCILSIINEGLPKDVYMNLTKGFVQAYGVREMLRLTLLEKAKLLYPRKGGWTSVSLDIKEDT